MKKVCSTLPDSLSLFYNEQSNCIKGSHGYWDLNCCAGTCKDCKSKSVAPLPDTAKGKEVKYNLFVRQKHSFINKKGETKESTRTVRESVTSNSDALYKELCNERLGYLKHRYEEAKENHIWPLVCDTIADIGPIYWVDFSENIQVKPKFQPQEQHFNQKQTSLFCTVGMFSSGRKYIYHISDEMGHDVGFTAHVMNDLYDTYNVIPTAVSESEVQPSDVQPSDSDAQPGVQQLSLFRIKSDNCCAQFKCKYVWGYWYDFAVTNDVIVIAYFGVPGHGKGLVDGMSAFGVKQPLRRAIMTEDFFFDTGSELTRYLKERFETKTDRVYHCIDPVDIKALRSKYKSSDTELVLKLSSKCPMISFFPDGTVKGCFEICACSKCLYGEFDQCSNGCKTVIYSGPSKAVDDDNDENEEDDDDEEDEEEDNDDELEENEMINVDTSFLTAGSYVAINSYSNFEQFYLCKVIKICVATDDQMDGNGHVVKHGEAYAECYYLQQTRHRRGKYFYKLLDKNVVFIQTNQVLCPFVNVSEED